MKAMEAYIQSRPVQRLTAAFPLHGHDRHIDAFLNYVFKLRIEVSDVVKRELEARDEYFKWLLNLESFTYERFKPEWLYHHQTQFYKERFARSNRLRSVLKTIHHDRPDLQLEEIMLNIYI